VTSEEFMVLWGQPDLRQYIIDAAKRRNRLPQLQEEYVQEAWMLISCAPAGYELAAYQELAYRAIYSAWWQTRKEYLLMRAMDQHVNAQMCKTLEEPTADEVDERAAYADDLRGWAG
jgi:hypothetical protein